LADPENRLVAGALEHRWHEALERVKDAEAPLVALEHRHVPLREEQRQHLRSLGQDLSAVWHHAAAPAVLKKRLLRTVLHEIILTTTQEPPEHLLHLHWQGRVHTELRVARHTAGKHGRATEHESIAVIRELSKVCRDLTIAATLNRLGYRTGTGKTWRAHSVACVRYQYRLPNFPQGTDWLTLKQAAQQLGGSATVIKRLMTQGTLPASQGVSQAPWIIQRTDLDRVAVQAEVQMVRTSHPPLRRLSDQRESPGQAALEAGDTHASSSPAETRSATLIAGAQ
jgi:hypothetical protein